MKENKIVVNEKDELLENKNYVVLDIETDGFGLEEKNQIIRISAVRIRSGNVVSQFDELIKPERKLSSKIIEITGITNEMLDDKLDEKSVVSKFLEWIADDVLVAHNASFVIEFLNSAIVKYSLNNIKNTIIDTLELSRILDEESKHNLKSLSNKYNLKVEETSHIGDELIVHMLYSQYVAILKERNVININQLNQLK